MTKKKEVSRRVSRRQFTRGAALGAVGAAAAALGGSAEAQGVTAAVPWSPTKWDYETDVVICGMGFAGQAAAIEADRAGAEVIILEKGDEDHCGGNSRVCGQGFVAPSPAIWEGYTEYLKRATTGEGFPQTDEWIQFFLEEGYKNLEWFRELGAEPVSAPPPFGQGGWIPFFPHFPGADDVASEPSFYWLDPELGPGRNWYFLDTYIKEKTKVTIMYETPVKRLIQVPVTREILGVVAEKDGEEVFVKARRGVVVCTGGYEYNEQMIRDYIHIPAFLSQGSPLNTGEGIKMCMAAGADLRNMGAFAAPSGLATRFPDYESAIPVALPQAGACIMVGANNRRWRDEYRKAKTGIQNKDVAWKEGTFNMVGSIVEGGKYVRDKYPLPIHMIFNEEARLSGKLFGSSMSWADNIEGYKCSENNEVEVEKGWVVKADTIRELAEKIGRDPDQLEDTIKRWNDSCKAGKDLEFDTGDPNFTSYDRPPDLLVPFTEGPFYAVELFPACLNTQGGMVRDTGGHVLDTEGKPIPRLYAAGENGGFWNHLYQCMSNVGADCYAMGRIAGTNAANEKPWG
ncbi:MAG: FAD-binding protein [Anaerolineae bacterium]|nr:FAD-binding protein [Anaerolineae bacterium]